MQTKLLRSMRDRVVIVTGAAGGMGEATARLFSAEGARVALADLRERELGEVVASLDAARAQAYALDVTDAAALSRMVEAVAAQWGGIDALVCNAGITADQLAGRLARR